MIKLFFVNCLKFLFKSFFIVSELKRSFIKKYNISDEDFKIMEIAIIENKAHKSGPQWKFAGAFYFSTLVLAMIGMLIINK